jgi:hypothetical protein
VGIGIRTALGAEQGHVVAVIGRRAAIQMPLAAWLFFNAEDPHHVSSPSAFVVALAPGVTAMLLAGPLARTAPLLRTLRIMPTEAMRSKA